MQVLKVPASFSATMAISSGPTAVRVRSCALGLLRAFSALADRAQRAANVVGTLPAVSLAGFVLIGFSPVVAGLWPDADTFVRLSMFISRFLPVVGR